jgi:pilus assembly protein CpaB
MVVRLGIFLVLVFALIVVAFFGLSILNQSNRPPVAAAPPPTVNILVAAAPIGGGALLQPGDIGSAPVLAGNVPPDTSLDTPENRSELIGSMVRIPIAGGAPILNSAVIHPGDHGFLAAVLAPGTRAVTVAVDNVTGANGLIWPGDHVDVLLTQNINGAAADHSIVAENVLRNVRVIATGQELIKNNGAGAGQTPPAQTVTLEVTPEQAQDVLVATNLGRLSLIVHSAMDVQTDAAAPSAAAGGGTTSQNLAVAQPVWSGDVSPVLAPAPTASGAPPQTVHVFAGGAGQDYNF